MEITWHGHSCVRINSRDVFLVADPYDVSGGEFLTPQKADIVTTSNSDPKHSHTAALTGNPRIIEGPGEYEVSHFYIKGTATPIDHADTPGSPINTIYTIRVESLIVAHLGGLTQRLTTSQMDSLRQTQVLIAPISGPKSITAPILQEIISTIQPRILLPVQYGSDDEGDLSDPTSYLNEIGISEVPEPSIRLTVTETNLPAEMQVQLLRLQR